ncbi:hypothetical protein JCM10914_1401 [Paenibacillus sp. JCM 10914]|nr:hypothetical protein JCM10914_1401 [Paenibacillus sp. JCM 10914]
MTREAIKQAALELFCRHGIEQTDMAEIAGAAGVARRTLYYHYKDKEALAAEIYIENLSVMFGELASSFRFEQPLESLDTILNRYLLLRQQSESLLYYDAIFNVYFSTLSKNPADLPEYKQLTNAAYSKLMQLSQDDISSEVQAIWLEKLYHSTHLLFTYLQKAVIVSRQCGAAPTEADYETDRRFKDFIMVAVSNG